MINLIVFAAAISLNNGWGFSLNGGTPRTVNVPHDWSIEPAPATTRRTWHGRAMAVMKDRLAL